MVNGSEWKRMEAKWSFEDWDNRGTIEAAVCRRSSK